MSALHGGERSKLEIASLGRRRPGAGRCRPRAGRRSRYHCRAHRRVPAARTRTWRRLIGSANWCCRTCRPGTRSRLRCLPSTLVRSAGPAPGTNVPVARMSLSQDEPEHFSRWLAHDGEAERDPDAVRRRGDVFPRRLGLRPLQCRTTGAIYRDRAIRNIREDASDVKRNGDGGIVTASGLTDRRRHRAR